MVLIATNQPTTICRLSNLLDNMHRILQPRLEQIQRLEQYSGESAREWAGKKRFDNGILQIKINARD